MMKATYAEALRGAGHAAYPRNTVQPPNRLETRIWDLMAALPGLWSGTSLSALADVLRCLTGRRHVFFASSCRAAIATVLSLLPQDEVVMPALTCPVVKTAVQTAGKRIIFVDSARNQLNSTSAEFEKYANPGRVLLPTHLFGIPTDVESICALARDRGCVTVEDAAAALGVKDNGRQLGTFGDIGIFSFERSKRFPAFRGAAIIVNNDALVDPAKIGGDAVLASGQSFPAREFAFSLLYNVATIPWLFGRLVLPHQLRKFAEWDPAISDYAADDPVHSPFYTRGFHPFQATLVLRMLKRLERIREKIRTLVCTYLETLSGADVVTLLPENRDDAGLLRFPIALPHIQRSQVLRLALQRGLFLETNYEQILTDEPNAGGFPNALWAAQNVVLLPLYTALSRENARDLAEQVAAIAAESAQTASQLHDDAWSRTELMSEQ